MPAMETERAHSRPPPPDTDVTGLDVALSDSRLPLPPWALDSLGAKVVRLQFHLKPYHNFGAISAAEFFSENKSWRPYSKPLIILAFAAVVIGLDGQDPEVLVCKADPGVGDGDDIIELLATVCRNDDLTPQ